MSFCYCGKLAADRVAWTDANAGGCRFFQWVDGPLCSRAQIVIPDLLRNMRGMESNYERQIVEQKKLT
ncbi:hypothetical protein DCAR_0520263 [Daucus carota subsp. sativus]|uniref:Uncharacterized protein n=1 Tax=Daucus carota subsp. sativus TaxID=79200 RepID=A0AAF0X5L1_DAUCS|nr:hypothetical protein DCAR_0520263 [Daucus carota subsp. sativus]